MALISRVSASWPFSASARRCSTPKRCCSSMTASARSRNATSGCKRAWVPTTTGVSPEARPASAASRARPFSRPVRRPISSPAGRPSRRKVAWCWRARISVGAISAACAPLSTALSIAISATRVLPLPTSPCNRRIIWRGCARSALISAIARRCAPVKAKPSPASTAAASLPVPTMARPRRRWRRARTRATASWLANTSS